MKSTVINYFISENYISDWTIEDALREIYQNFIDYGEYSVNKSEHTEVTDKVIFANAFEPQSTDLLIIGDSNKTEASRGKYGEGLKMAALVLLRNGGHLSINTTNFSAMFLLLDNETTKIKTLGVIIEEPRSNLKVNNFDLFITLPIGVFDAYQKKLIVPTDVLHTNENYGSIVNKPKGNLYVGGLYVCHLKELNYSYDLLPKRISLDRDRKVPQNFEVKWTISKIQETYTEFDPTGKSEDVIYSAIPEKYNTSYTPRVRGNKVVFTTKVINEQGEEKEIEVSDRFNSQLEHSGFFEKLVFKLKSFIASSLNIDQLALKYRQDYCHGMQAEAHFDSLMLRLGVDIKKLVKIDNTNLDEYPF
jgi:hypothetical protein